MDMTTQLHTKGTISHVVSLSPLFTLQQFNTEYYTLDPLSKLGLQYLAWSFHRQVEEKVSFFSCELWG